MMITKMTDSLLLVNTISINNKTTPINLLLM